MVNKKKFKVLDFSNTKISNNERKVEAILFAAAEPLDVETVRARIGKAIDVDKILLSLQKHYSSRGINLVCIKNKWSFRTSDDLSELMSLQKPTQKKLSKAAIETLAIIVYHQPVTRSEIEEIRGVAFASGTMEILIELNWVRPAGRKNVPGKPIQYATTDDFLSHFNLNNLSDLPNVEELTSAGLIDSSSVDSSIFGTKNYLEKNHSTDNENLYSNIDQLIKGVSNDNKKK
jgi:segregation and condensation protein B